MPFLFGIDLAGFYSISPQYPQKPSTVLAPQPHLPVHWSVDIHLQPPHVPSSIIVRAPVIGSQWAPLFDAEHKLVVPGEPQSRRQVGGPAADPGVPSSGRPASTARLVSSWGDTVGAARVVMDWRRNERGIVNWNR